MKKSSIPPKKYWGILKPGRETNRAIRFFTGLTISLSLVFLAFNWRTPVIESDFEYRLDLEEIVEDEIPPTVVKEKKDEPKKKIKPPTEELPPEKQEPIAKKTPSTNVIEIRKNADETGLPDLDSTFFFPDEYVDEEQIFTVVKSFPVFPGECEDILNNEERKRCTESKMYELFRNKQRYPELMRREGIQGNVVVSFVIDETGQVSSVEILKGVNGGKQLDEEAVRLVNALPQFIPGENRGRKVKVRINVPMNFTLRN